MARRFSVSLATLLLSACAQLDSPETTPVQMSEFESVEPENIADSTSSPETTDITQMSEGAPSIQPMPAHFIEYADFKSNHVKPRNITVWLPHNYRDSVFAEGYPVIYAHDGQNMFHFGHSGDDGKEWQLDETADQMMQSGEVPEAIIVGIWNTDLRWQEYAPQKVLEEITPDTASDWLGPEMPELYGDAYLKFIVEELKPFIDSEYNTRTAPEDTAIMGSSMGGLISLYAAAEYPDVFGRAAAVSIHWPLAEPDGAIAAQAVDAMQAYLGQSRLDMTNQKLWFDHGTETLDAAYPPFASAMEAWFRDQGWRETQAQFHTYEGTPHSETAWADRVDDILVFLLTEETE